MQIGLSPLNSTFKRTPLRDGDIERPDDPVYANAYFINANSGTVPLYNFNLEPYQITSFKNIKIFFEHEVIDIHKVFFSIGVYKSKSSIFVCISYLSDYQFSPGFLFSLCSSVVRLKKCLFEICICNDLIAEFSAAICPQFWVDLPSFGQMISLLSFRLRVGSVVLTSSSVSNFGQFAENTAGPPQYCGGLFSCQRCAKLRRLLQISQKPPGALKSTFHPPGCIW